MAETLDPCCVRHPTIKQVTARTVRTPNPWYSGILASLDEYIM
jgi:hypothetical protein